MKYQIIPVKPAEQIGVLTNGSNKFPVVELAPKPGSRYVIQIEVGDLPPREAHAYMQKLIKSMGSFFKPGEALFMPSRHGEPSSQIYELVPDSP